MALPDNTRRNLGLQLQHGYRAGRSEDQQTEAEVTTQPPKTSTKTTTEQTESPTTQEQSTQQTDVPTTEPATTQQSTTVIGNDLQPTATVLATISMKEACLTPPEKGDCEQYFPRYYFDTSVNKCRPFGYR